MSKEMQVALKVCDLRMGGMMDWHEVAQELNLSVDKAKEHFRRFLACIESYK